MLPCGCMLVRGWQVGKRQLVIFEWQEAQQGGGGGKEGGGRCSSLSAMGGLLEDREERERKMRGVTAEMLHDASEDVKVSKADRRRQVGGQRPVPSTGCMPWRGSHCTPRMPLTVSAWGGWCWCWGVAGGVLGVRAAEQGHREEQRHQEEHRQAAQEQRKTSEAAAVTAGRQKEMGRRGG